MRFACVGDQDRFGIGVRIVGDDDRVAGRALEALGRDARADHR